MCSVIPFDTGDKRLPKEDAFPRNRAGVDGLLLPDPVPLTISGLQGELTAGQMKSGNTGFFPLSSGQMGWGCSRKFSEQASKSVPYSPLCTN